MTPRRLLGLLVSLPAVVLAAPLPYQGILTDSAGIPVPDGDIPVVFALHGNASGGAPLWTESRTVATRKGLFSVGLGETTPLPDSLFARDSLFLEVVANGKPFVPRSRLGASPWSMRAKAADTARVARQVLGWGTKVDTAALTTRLSGYANAASLSAYARTTDLANYATASSLAAYAKTTDLSAYAKSTDLANYAKNTDLANYATASSLANYARTTDLSVYAKSTDLSVYAKTTALAAYATTASLAGYATTTSLATKADAATVSALDSRTTALEASPYQPTTWKVAMGTPNGVMEYIHNLNYSGLTLTQHMVATGDRTDIMLMRQDYVRFFGDVKVDGSIIVAGTTLTVPDYVFEPDYRLAPLSEVEAYVRANKHLPEVPSASEIEKGGQDMAAMNLILLKKVEELTLHAIAQEKRIQALEERLK